MITHKNTETCTFFKKLSPQWKNNSFHKPVNNTKLLGLLELWLHVFKSSGLSDFQTLDLSVLHLMALQFGFLTKKWQPPLYFPGSLMQFPFWHVFTDIFESKFSRMDQKNLWKTNFKKLKTNFKKKKGYDLPKQDIPLQFNFWSTMRWKLEHACYIIRQFQYILPAFPGKMAYSLKSTLDPIQ